VSGLDDGSGKTPGSGSLGTSGTSAATSAESTAQAAADRANATQHAGRQGLLFGDDVQSLPTNVGFRGPIACSAAGITYRQLDYWARTGLLEPSVRGAAGSGSQRLYSFRDILVLKVIKRLLDTGVSLQNIRTAVEHLRERGVDDLAGARMRSSTSYRAVRECSALQSAGSGARLKAAWRNFRVRASTTTSCRPPRPWMSSRHDAQRERSANTHREYWCC